MALLCLGVARCVRPNMLAGQPDRKRVDQVKILNLSTRINLDRLAHQSIRCWNRLATGWPRTRHNMRKWNSKTVGPCHFFLVCLFHFFLSSHSHTINLERQNPQWRNQLLVTHEGDEIHNIDDFVLGKIQVRFGRWN